MNLRNDSCMTGMTGIKSPGVEHGTVASTRREGLVDLAGFVAHTSNTTT